MNSYRERMHITTTRGSARDIDDWDPEDVTAWNNGGAKIARRNLIWSIFAEHVGFSVWSIWSVMVLFMPQDVYHIDAAGKFFLVAVPTLVGAVMRIPYTVRGGQVRRTQLDHHLRAGCCWSRPSLTLYLMAHPGASYTTFLIVAALRRTRRRQLRVVDGQHQRLLPAAATRAGRSVSTPVAATSVSR